MYVGETSGDIPCMFVGDAGTLETWQTLQTAGVDRLNKIYEVNHYHSFIFIKDEHRAQFRCFCFILCLHNKIFQYSTVHVHGITRMVNKNMDECLK